MSPLLPIPCGGSGGLTAEAHVIKPDFHVHSLYSDGVYTVDEVYAHIEEEKLTHFALTDHDTVRGIEKMSILANKNPQCCFLPGCEVSCGGGGRTHMLIYGNVCTPELEKWLLDYEAIKAERVLKMVELLGQQGLVLNNDAVQRLSHGNIGRPHIVRELIAAGYVQNIKQAFDRYLNEGKCCYVPYDRPAVSDMLDKLRTFPVVPVLAHPFKIGLESQTAVFSFIESLIPHGLMGVEAFHPSANARQARMLEGFAREHGLLVTGGSDFHGDLYGHANLGDTGSPWHRMEQDTEALLEAAARTT